MEFIQYCSDIGGFLGFVVFYLLLKQKATDKMEEMEKAMKYYRKELIAAFDNSAYSANVSICSAGVWCDRLYGFPYLVERTSMRSSVKTTDVFQECVHPFDDGYKSFADGIFSSIKYLETT